MTSISYNKNRPYTRDLWSEIQTVVGAVPDGIPGEETSKKITAWQSANELTADGCCGPITLMAMGLGPFLDIGDGYLRWRGGLAVDADGAPNAYSPRDTGIDFLTNAGKPGSWWGIATDASGLPFVQGPTDPYPNHYVSTTALTFQQHPISDPRRYVDSRAIEYVVLPRNIEDLLPSGWVCELGASGEAQRGERASAVIYADVGPYVVLDRDRMVNNREGTRSRLLGEGSIALAVALGHDPYRLRDGLWRASSGIADGIEFSLHLTPRPASAAD